MNKAFNLLDEQWIPVRYLDGRTDQLGLLQLFADARRIRALAETEPPSLIALYRMLLAITHRAFTRRFGRWTVNDMALHYRDGLPLDAIEEYLEHWRERFWLFHPDEPFMQVPALAGADATRDKFKPWTQIALDAACGNTPALFDHSMDGMTAPIDTAPALRKLLGFLQFTPGGLVKVLRTSDNAGPVANTAAVLPLGETLAHTLCLALHPAPREEQEDMPTWERTPPTLAQLCEPATLASGPNDRYTRLSRSVLLCQDTAGGNRISMIRFAEGLALAEDENARDRMASYRAGTNGMVRLSFSEGRAVWRDLGNLLPDGSGKRNQPAAVLSWATTLFERVKSSDEDV
jgi:CRISPR system Cascade subunit CasA